VSILAGSGERITESVEAPYGYLSSDMSRGDEDTSRRQRVNLLGSRDATWSVSIDFIATLIVNDTVETQSVRTKVISLAT